MMEKKIEDYLHLYYGQKIKYRNPANSVSYVTTIGQEEIGYRYSDMKIILRPLSDMTEDEAAETHTWIQWTERNSTNGQTSGYDADQIRRMLAKGFDLFGLIESGLAIDKTTLTIKPST